MAVELDQRVVGMVAQGTGKGADGDRNLLRPGDIFRDSVAARRSTPALLGNRASGARQWPSADQQNLTP